MNTKIGCVQHDCAACQKSAVPKLTLWFRPEIKPVHVGVYATKLARDGMPDMTGFSHWDGSKWGFQAGVTEMAASDHYTFGNGEQFKSWRGLAEKPA